MKIFFPLLFATVYGLLIRLLFGILGDIMGIMSLSFFVIVPFATGFLTVILIPRKKRIGNGAAFFLPWLTCLLLLLLTIFLSIEGLICWMMAYPLFAIVAGLGGLLANRIRRKKEVEVDDVENYNKWTKPDKLSVSLLMLLPLVFATGEGERLSNRQDMEVTRSVVINAGSAAAWHALGNINAIKQEQKPHTLSSLLGFPKHIETTLDTLTVGGKRKAVYEKGLYFDETISHCEPGKLLVLDIKTDPATIPPTVMDEHILIGGKHVDVLQDIYTLEDLNNGSCRLTLTSHFFINTPFNWYAGIWSRWLMNDILGEELQLVKTRAEQQR